MAMAASPYGAAPDIPALRISPLARHPSLRVLLWSGSTLYASRGYTLLARDVNAHQPAWAAVARFHPPAWRRATGSFRLASRLCRDGFHALARLSDGTLVAAVPGAIVRCPPGQSTFEITHSIVRGTRPLHLAVGPDDRICFGEYFDNAARAEAYIYASSDRGAHWDVAHAFPARSIRHVHNIVHDPWDGAFWVLTGDYGEECRILRASRDFSRVETVLAGNQQARAVALLPAPEGIYFASDTPLESNHIYCMERNGNLRAVAATNSSSLYGGRSGSSLFFSTMVEPGKVNRRRLSCLYGSANGRSWATLAEWKKDIWPM